MTEAASHWDQLHNHRRFRPQYPNDHVVRFLLDSLGGRKIGEAVFWA
jgi:hypothetical protein